MAQKSSKSLMLPKFDRIDNWPQCTQIIRAIMEELLKAHELAYRDVRDIYNVQLPDVTNYIDVLVENYTKTENLEVYITNIINDTYITNIINDTYITNIINNTYITNIINDTYVKDIIDCEYIYTCFVGCGV